MLRPTVFGFANAVAVASFVPLLSQAASLPSPAQARGAIATGLRSPILSSRELGALSPEMVARVFGAGAEMKAGAWADGAHTIRAQAILVPHTAGAEIIQTRVVDGRLVGAVVSTLNPPRILPGPVSIRFAEGTQPELVTEYEADSGVVQVMERWEGVGVQAPEREGLVHRRRNPPLSDLPELEQAFVVFPALNQPLRSMQIGGFAVGNRMSIIELVGPRRRIDLDVPPGDERPIYWQIIPGSPMKLIVYRAGQSGPVIRSEVALDWDVLSATIQRIEALERTQFRAGVLGRWETSPDQSANPARGTTLQADGTRANGFGSRRRPMEGGAPVGGADVGR